MISIGVRYMVLSALGFALMTACVKVVGNYGIPVLEIVAARAIVSLVISYVDVRRKKLSIWGNNKPLLIARGCAGALALMCVYFAVTSLPLAEATILQYLYPVFTAILALIFLKERVRFTTIACIVLCIAGLLIMVRPDFLFGGVLSEDAMSLPPLSVAAALLGALGSAIAYVIVKKLSNTEDSSVIIFYFPLIALPISMVLLFLADSLVVPDFKVLGLMVLIGIFTQIGQVGLTKAMQVEAASTATAYSYIQVIFSMLLGWVIFSEVPTYWTWVGGGLIIGGALINLYGSAVQKRLQKTAS